MRAKIFSALILAVILCSAVSVASVPSVTMLSTKTCPACEQMESVLKELNSKYKGRVSTVHIYLEDKPELAKQYNVRYVPMLIFKDASGKEAAREVGYRSVDEVMKIFAKAGVKI